MQKRNKYSNYYYWETPLSNEIIGHNDGAVSCMLNWDGLDCEMDDKQQQHAKYQALYKFIEGLDDCVAEFHHWREKDTRQAENYLNNNIKIKRGRHFGEPVRKAMAQHLSQFGWNNECAIVLYRKPQANLLSQWSRKSAFKDQVKNAERLQKTADNLKRIISGSFADPEHYFKRVIQSYWRKGYKRGYQYPLDFREDLANQVIYQAPHQENGMVKIDGEYTKVILLYHYPDADPAWFLNLSAISCEMHACQIVVPTDTRRLIDKHSQASEKESVEQSRKGTKYRQRAIQDREDFTSYVAQNNLSIFKNAFILHLHGPPDHIQAMSKEIEDWVFYNQGLAKSHDDIQSHFFRAGQPGHGAISGFLRQDETWQVANMAPAIVYDKGTLDPEYLRVTSSGQLVGLSIMQHTVNHGFTVAMTGAGKGVDKGCQIIETYPLGLDWFIVEVGSNEGSTYQWVVEGFGKTFVKFDPDKHVINPLPDYDLTSGEGKTPVPIKLCAGTVSALAYLLTDGKTQLSSHQRAAAEEALQNLYRTPIEGKTAPRMDHYCQSLDQTQYNSQPQKDAAKRMADNLSSFLDSSVGRRFTMDGNLSLSKELCGVDLKGALDADPKLLIFCLTSLSLRYAQMAFFSSTNPARVEMDEVHVFERIAPEVVTNLCSQISRMGRKDYAGLDLITQGLHELRTMDPEIVASTTLRNLMYRKEDHDEMAKILQIPKTPLQRWKNFPNPETLNWRPSLCQVQDKYYDLFLSFPEIVLNTCSTSPLDLSFKSQIPAETGDIFQRLERLKQLKSAN
ncbi:MAG: hypothetical protein HKP58_01200 [Desulfatitalea sp.]|nr:hypothetical protein [Desulfatitalea sp.]NNJ99003.1 hypothetical protein [Desulfatitalea sp.]